MRFILAIGTMFTLAACAPTTPPVEPITVQSEPLRRPALNLPAVDDFRARPVEWTVITPDNVDEVFARLEASGEPLAIFGVNEQGYENIALNTSESLRVIMQQKSVIEGYRKYYIEADGIIYEYNQSIN